MNLGRVEAALHRWEDAERCVRAALGLNPSSVKALFLLAEISYTRGDLAAAREALSRALALRPEQPELLELQEKLRAAPPP